MPEKSPQQKMGKKGTSWLVDIRTFSVRTFLVRTFHVMTSRVRTFCAKTFHVRTFCVRTILVAPQLIRNRYLFRNVGRFSFRCHVVLSLELEKSEDIFDLRF